MILSLNVNEECYSIKMIYPKSIHLKTKQYKHEFYINHDKKTVDGAIISFSLTPTNGHEKKQYMKIMSRMLLMCFIIEIFIALMFVIEGTQLEFPLPDPRDPLGTPMDLIKYFFLTIFKSESVERTHLYSYVFH